MKRTTHLLSITKISGIWSLKQKDRTEYTSIVLNHKNDRNTKDTKDAILKKDIRSQRRKKMNYSDKRR